MLTNLCLAIFCLLGLVSNVLAIPKISAVGSKFFTSDGKQFYIKGVAYQLTYQDPLVDTNQCQLDAALMKQLGANSIRVYHVDGGADHSGCMNAFADAGIYLWVDMDSFSTYITIDNQTSWTQQKFDSYKAIMDNFQQFDNTAGFFVGNEVLNVVANAPSAPYVLTAVADLKSYQNAKGYRKIPIGYSATDTTVLRPMLQNYLVCRKNESERVDFYSLNSYEWCGSQSSYTISGYNLLQRYADGYPAPIFLSEDGCNTVPPRTFDDQSAIFGPQMSGTWSGAIIYEWIQETNDYGLVNYGPFAGKGVNEGTSVVDGFSRQGTPTPISPDFSNLQAQWATLSPTGVALSAYASSASGLTQPACPTPTPTGWNIDPNAPLPTIGQAVVSSSGSTTSNTASATSATGSASATGRASAAGKTNLNPLSAGENSFMGMLIALLTVGVAAICWL